MDNVVNMEALKQSIQSFLHLRRALLRKVESQSPLDFSLFEATNMSATMRRRRGITPSTWRFDELVQLATSVGLSPRPINILQYHLSLIDVYIGSLSDVELRRFYSITQLSTQKLGPRKQDPKNWQVADLERIVLFMETMHPKPR